jgi:ABC-2 type transport system permease protein
VKKFLILLKKEIKELITLQMILPLIVMVVIFSFIGNMVSKETAKMKAPQPILIANQDTKESGEKLSEILEAANFKPTILDKIDIDKALIQARESNILTILVISSDFKKNMDSFKPQEIMVYKIAENFSIISSAKYSGLDRAIAIINTYYSNEWIQKKNVNIAPEILKNPIKTNEIVVIKDKKANVPLSAVLGYIQKQTIFIPIILFMVIIMAAQMVAMAVASEKENKTFEILLSSPINRKTIIFAKLIGAGVVALLFAGVYMIGFNFYMKGLTSGATPATGDGLMNIFASLGIIIGPLGYLLLGLSLFMGILVALAISMVLGIMADSVKSVQTVVTPLMVLILIPYFLILFININSLSPILRYIVYAIPFSHPFLASQNIFLGSFAPIVYGIIYQFVIFMIFVILAARIFSSDKIITLKLRFGKRKS